MSRSFIDLPEITSENFERSLSSDPVFLEFFNDFLRLPVFAVAVRYDGMSAGFELLDHTAVVLSCRIRTALHQIQSRSVSEPSWIPAEPVRDNRYTVTRLDRDQTIRWLKRDRLAFFFQSDCYFEFRLAKCLSRVSGPFRSQSPANDGTCSSWDEGCLLSDQRVCSFPEDMAFSSPETREHNAVDALQTEGRTSDAAARRSFLDFKRSLVGGPGENVLHLWMDIERLRTLGAQNKSRYLQWMKAQYVFSSSAAALDEQLLSRLGLNSTVCWREERLRDVQPRLTEILLLYWGQRFLLFPSDQWQMSECVSSYCVQPQPVCACSDAKDSSEFQTLLEVLHTEFRSGFFFTHFCQSSGRQLWEHAVYFCSELQQYHQLFCQSRFDPYRAQRTAQLLYLSYLSSGAQMSVGLNEEDRRDILTRLSPAFEDLFDQAQEHALNVLLEPWRQLSETLRETLHTVALWQEVRYSEAELFQTLQTLYAHTQSRAQQDHRTAPAEGSAPDLWAKVPQEFRRFRLDSLLRNHVELQLFLSFLEENSASLVLQCWLDIEQLKNSDGPLLKERNMNFKDKYLSSDFLFGPGSPATEEQQMKLLQVCGGLQHLQCKSVSLAFLTELQSLLHNRLETRWLPLFLSSSEFMTRQRRQVAGVCEQQTVVHQRKRRRVWKPSAGPMSCSQEAGRLRRALSNPVTRLQFQTFLSVRDDLLENDLLFWLEVQRYKELCHSRCDDVTLQRKVSIIICCFFQSSVPPALQIHVPPEAAQLVTSQQRTLGPYVFRETQTYVFGELLKHWPDFLALRSSVGEDGLLRVLDEKRRDRRRSRQTDEQDDSRSQGYQDEADEELQDCGNDCMRASHKISWSYWRHMTALEQESSPADVTTSSSSSTSSSETGRAAHSRRRNRTE